MIRWSWAYLPFVMIGASAIANGIIILTSSHVRPQQVDDRPWVRSATMDADRAARDRFAEHWTLTAAPRPGGLDLTLTGEAISDVQIACWRPDDESLDHAVAWDIGTHPLALDLPRSGRWRLTLTGRSAAGPVAADLDVHVPAPGQNAPPIAFTTTRQAPLPPAW